MSGINGGSLLSWHPHDNYEKYIQYDREMKETCCGIAGHCELYYTREDLLMTVVVISHLLGVSSN